MKKYLAVLICCVFVGISLSTHVQFKSDPLHSIGISLSNVEALAQGEGNQSECVAVGCVDCPVSGIKVKYVE